MIDANGIPSAISAAALVAAIGPGAAHDKARQAVPEARLLGACVAVGGALEALGRERVDARAEHRAEEKQRQQEDERECEQLGVREVIADLGVRLGGRDLLTAEAHVTLPREMILDPL